MVEWFTELPLPTLSSRRHKMKRSTDPKGEAKWLVLEADIEPTEFWIAVLWPILVISLSVAKTLGGNVSVAFIMYQVLPHWAWMIFAVGMCIVHLSSLLTRTEKPRIGIMAVNVLFWPGLGFVCFLGGFPILGGISMWMFSQSLWTFMRLVARHFLFKRLRTGEV